METKKVVIDADFFRKYTDGELNTNLLEKVLNELEYVPVMHRYVADVELEGNCHLKRLIADKKIEVIDESRYILEEDKEDYEDYFRAAYKKANHLDLGEEDVFKYGYDRSVLHQSLGEIRSLYMARKMGYDIFLSDDGDSRTIADYLNSSRRQIKVIDVPDALINCHKKGTKITYKDIRNLIFKLKKERCSEMRLKKIEEVISLYKAL